MPHDGFRASEVCYEVKGLRALNVTLKYWRGVLIKDNKEEP